MKFLINVIFLFAFYSVYSMKKSPSAPLQKKANNSSIPNFLERDPEKTQEIILRALGGKAETTDEREEQINVLREISLYITHISCELLRLPTEDTIPAVEKFSEKIKPYLPEGLTIGDLNPFLMTAIFSKKFSDEELVKLDKKILLMNPKNQSELIKLVEKITPESKPPIVSEIIKTMYL